MLTLYHTLGCHLCEQAEALLLAENLVENVDFSKVDIADNESLVDAYGVHIPVLASETLELFWPFDAYALQQFLAS